MRRRGSARAAAVRVRLRSPCRARSRNEDPTVRGLALRSLCSLRLPSAVEYLLPPLQVGTSIACAAPCLHANHYAVRGSARCKTPARTCARRAWRAC